MCNPDVWLSGMHAELCPVGFFCGGVRNGRHLIFHCDGVPCPYRAVTREPPSFFLICLDILFSIEVGPFLVSGCESNPTQPIPKIYSGSIREQIRGIHTVKLTPDHLEARFHPRRVDGTRGN